MDSWTRRVDSQLILRSQKKPSQRSGHQDAHGRRPSRWCCYSLLLKKVIYSWFTHCTWCFSIANCKRLPGTLKSRSWIPLRRLLQKWDGFLFCTKTTSTCQISGSWLLTIFFFGKRSPGTANPKKQGLSTSRFHQVPAPIGRFGFGLGLASECQCQDQTVPCHNQPFAGPSNKINYLRVPRSFFCQRLGQTGPIPVGMDTIDLLNWPSGSKTQRHNNLQLGCPSSLVI